MATSTLSLQLHENGYYPFPNYYAAITGIDLDAPVDLRDKFRLIVPQKCLREEIKRQLGVRFECDETPYLSIQMGSQDLVSQYLTLPHIPAKDHISFHDTNARFVADIPMDQLPSSIRIRITWRPNMVNFCGMEFRILGAEPSHNGIMRYKLPKRHGYLHKLNISDMWREPIYIVVDGVECYMGNLRDLGGRVDNFIERLPACSFKNAIIRTDPTHASRPRIFLGSSVYIYFRDIEPPYIGIALDVWDN